MLLGSFSDLNALRGIGAWSMIRKSGHRFSEKIMLKQKDRAG
jgi:hypothetical protein